MSDSRGALVSVRGSSDSSVAGISVRQAFFAPANTAPDYWLSGWYPKAGLAQGYATANTPSSEWNGGGSAPMLILQPEHDAVRATLAPLAAPYCRKPLPVEGLAVFEQVARDRPFTITGRYAFEGD